MFHPKSLVLATPQVLRGAPICLVNFCLEYDGISFEEDHPAAFGGWTFMHQISSDVPELELHFFREVERQFDYFVQDVVDQAVPGTYVRDSEFAPFERDDDLDIGGVDKKHDDRE